jgi:hypothetical protein
LDGLVTPRKDGEIPKATLQWNTQGSKKTKKTVGGDRLAGRSWNELRFLAADRQKWKEFVDNLRS